MPRIHTSISTGKYGKTLRIFVEGKPGGRVSLTEGGSLEERARTFQKSASTVIDNWVQDGGKHVEIFPANKTPFIKKIPHGVETLVITANGFKEDNTLARKHVLPSSLKILWDTSPGKFNKDFLFNIPSSLEEFVTPFRTPSGKKILPTFLEKLLQVESPLPNLNKIHIGDLGYLNLDQYFHERLAYSWIPMYRKLPFMLYANGNTLYWGNNGIPKYHWVAARPLFVKSLFELQRSMITIYQKELSLILYKAEICPGCGFTQYVEGLKYLMQCGQHRVLWDIIKNTRINNPKYDVPGTWLHVLTQKFNRGVSNGA